MHYTVLSTDEDFAGFLPDQSLLKSSRLYQSSYSKELRVYADQDD